MEKIYLNRFILLLITTMSLSGLFAQVTYVKHDATGANNGTSWQDAYTKLDDALSNTSSGQVWVAAGTYKPGGATPDTSSVFTIENGIALYGGFAGTEDNLNQRDPAANPTILSGDIANDDVLGDFTVNKSDNTRHVVYVLNTISEPASIDGFSIIGGHTSDYGSNTAYFRTGGGIYALGPVYVSNCSFYNNFGRSGGAIFLGDLASGSQVTNCAFTKNYSTSQSAGIFANAVSDVIIRRCTFSDNVTNRGVVYPLYVNNSSIDSCIFQSNQNPGGYGAALFIWNPTNLSISNCAFTGNTAANGAVMNYNGTELTGEATNNFTIKNCLFKSNVATDFGGGAIYNSAGAMTVENCTFEENNAANGAHVFQNAAGKKVKFKNCNFLKASCSGWGGAATCYGLDAEFTFEQCVFEDNIANNLGGAMNCGFRAKVFIDDCTFTGNTSNTSAGGAISLQNDSTTLVVTNSTFENNQSSSSGGAIHAGTGSCYATLDKCAFIANGITGTQGVGGAVNASESGDDDIGILELSNSIFFYNLAPEQAGALNLSNVDATIYNCLFAFNVANGTGAGGAISNNASDSSHVEVSILNSTFADNAGVLAGGISNWTALFESSSNLTLQNCIFRQDGLLNYAIEDGTPQVISKGGNLSDDLSFEDYFTHEKDINEDEPTFVDPDNFDYHLANGSLGINAGVNEGAPEFDLDGNPRIGDVDMGAYENQTPSAAEEVLANDGMLVLSPNPASGANVKVVLENYWQGQLEARLYNVMGQAVRTIKIEKVGGVLQFEFPLTELKTGVYHLLISNGNQAVGERLIRL